MHRLEPTSDPHRYLLATSHLGEHVLDLAVAAPPREAVLALPERYGIPLFELLAVDTRYVFLSWEITAEQVAQARMSLGGKTFDTRKLKVLLRRENRQGEVLGSSELFGEVGRWFLRIDHPGAVVLAELAYVSGQESFSLNNAGPLSIPREDMVEPEGYDELKVAYGRGRHGRLILLGIERRRAQWPSLTLPAPTAREYAPAQLPAAPGYGSMAGQAAPQSGGLASWAGKQHATAGEEPPREQ